MRRSVSSSFMLIVSLFKKDQFGLFITPAPSEVVKAESELENANERAIKLTRRMIWGRGRRGRANGQVNEFCLDRLRDHELANVLLDFPLS